jgi:hypothetical protein
VRDLRRKSPRDVVTVFIPEYVVGHWWEQLLHNQSALRLKSRLLFQPGVMVTSVAYQLRSSAIRNADDDDGPAAGDARRPRSTAASERGLRAGPRDGGAGVPRAVRASDGSRVTAPDDAAVEAELVLEVGAVAAGGACVGRAPDGRVVFVRHCLPRRAGPRPGHRRDGALPARRRRRGPRRVAGPRRAALPVRRARPVRWLRLAARRARRAAAAEGRARCRSSCAGWRETEWPVFVEPVPGDDDGLGWRTRVQFAWTPPADRPAQATARTSCSGSTPA